MPYRGHADRLFKRDFAGELLDRLSRPERLSTTASPTAAIPAFPQDDITWFLLEKAGPDMLTYCSRCVMPNTKPDLRAR